MSLSIFIKNNALRQSEIADALRIDPAQVNRLTKPGANPTRQTIDAILAYLSERLGRPVSYEEAFGGEGAVSDQDVA